MASRPILSVTAPQVERRGEGLVNAKLREHAARRSSALKSNRKDVDPIVGEICSLTQPARTRFMPRDGSTGNRRRSTSNRLQDGHGTYCSRVLTNGMNSGLSSPSSKWFKLKISDADLMKFYSVKAWLGAVEQVMYDFLGGTNFYEAAKLGYGELGLFGTEACFMESHWRCGLVSHPLTFGEYWIADGDDLRPDTLLRSAPMSTMQVVSRFVADSFDSSVLHWDRVSTQIRNAWDNSNYDNVFEISHLCERNPAWDPARLDVAGKPWRSVYWEPSNDADGKLLSVEGCFEQPFYAARWEASGGGDPYGTGPGWDALADLRALQLDAKRLGDAKDLVIKPPIGGTAIVKNRLNAGSYTTLSLSDSANVKVLRETPWQVLRVLEDGIQRYYGKLNETFYVDLFMAISQMDGVQPRNNQEIFSRNEEKLVQLGPVIERVNVEKLGVAIDRAFGICMRMGLFPEPPEELQGMELQVDYISTLAQAQRAVGLATMERSLGFIGNLAGVYPGITDNIDSDAVAINYWERSGAPMLGLRDPKARDAERQQRAQAQAAAQSRETMPAAAQGAKAAELMSKTDTRGGNSTLLDDMLARAGG